MAFILEKVRIPDLLPLLPSWLKTPGPRLSAAAWLQGSLERDLGGDGFTEIGWAPLPCGWTLQLGDVPYDWDESKGVLYRRGAALVEGFRGAECRRDEGRPGRWWLRGDLRGERFAWSFSGLRDGRQAHPRELLYYWLHCFFMELRRSGWWRELPDSGLLTLNRIEDDVHGLTVWGRLVRGPRGLCLICSTVGGLFYAKLLEPEDWQGPVRLANPQGLSTAADVAAVLAGLPASGEAALVRACFRQYWIDRARRSGRG